jgi:hypothetical protein
MRVCEWFPSPGEIFSFGAFYKDLKNPIELYLVQLDGNDITWINRESAKVWGLEFEARKSLRFLSRHLEEFTDWPERRDYQIRNRADPHRIQEQDRRGWRWHH